MSKVDPLGPRPTSPGTGWSNASATAEAYAAHADGVGTTARAGGGLRSTSPIGDSPDTSLLLGSRSSARNRRRQLSTAEKPPVTKPVEGPEPPAWLESRLGLLRDPSEGGGPSAASLASVGACHGGSTTASEWTSPGLLVLDSKSCSTAGSGGGVLTDGDDESSAFALSFTSARWAVSDDEGSEGAQASNLWLIKGAGERQAAKARLKPGVRKKARHRGRKRGRVHDRSGGGGGKVTAAPAAKPFSKADVSPPQGSQRERERNMAQRPIDDDINSSGSGIRKPQPELYDVWVPHHFFQGKGLSTLKRVKGVVEPQPPRSPRPRATQAAASSDIEGDNPSAKPPNQGVDSLSRDRHRHAYSPRRQHKQTPATDFFVKGDASPPPPHVSARAGPPGAEKEADLEAKHLIVGCDDDDDRDGRLWSNDTRGGKSALVGDAAEDGGSIAGWQEQEGLEQELDDDEYFDYAKRFSWQMAAEAVKQAEADAEARSREERRTRQRGSGDERQDGGVSEVRGAFFL